MQIDTTHWYEQLLDLIELLYQANNPNAIGQKLFQGLGTFIDFDAAIFTPINWQTLELQEGICFGDFSRQQPQASCVHAPFDPFLFDPLCLTRLNQTIKLSDTAISTNALPAVDDVGIYQPYQYAMGVVASWREQPVAAIRLYRYAESQDFAEHEVKLLNRFAPHVANAIYFQDTTIAFEPLRETGLLVFSANDSLLYKNEAVTKMLEGIPLELVLQRVKEGNIWLKNGLELYRTELVPLSPSSLLTLLAKNEEQHNLIDSNQSSAPITIISIEPFRRRYAVANRLKHNGLSPREIDVALGIMRGLSNSNIAKQLFIDEKTVKDHLQRIYAKVHIKTRTELISKMLGLDTELAQHEMANPPDPLN